jgi:pimeloyl-ACP methyl ester carboxylesterase
MPPDLQVAVAEDGRRLTFAEWGDADGHPVISLHGTPGSRLGRHYDVSVYAGARLITYDRPGYGGSDRHRGRRVVDCASDVAAIADTLGIERFAVRGGSGGGPHALAVAALLPERVTRAACAVSPAPYDAEDIDWRAGMDPLNVRELEWALQGEEELAPELEREAAGMLERIADDPAKLLGDDWGLSEADRAQLARTERHGVIREQLTEAVRNGVWGWVDDDLCITRPWGFDPGVIRVPAQVIYGLTDVLVPVAHGEWLARHMPGAEVVAREDLGHLDTSEGIAEEIEWLLRPV